MQRHSRTNTHTESLQCWHWPASLLWDRDCSVCLLLPAAVCACAHVHACTCACGYVSRKLLICGSESKEKEKNWQFSSLVLNVPPLVKRLKICYKCLDQLLEYFDLPFISKKLSNWGLGIQNCWHFSKMMINNNIHMNFMLHYELKKTQEFWEGQKKIKQTGGSVFVLCHMCMRRNYDKVYLLFVFPGCQCGQTCERLPLHHSKPGKWM